MININNNDLQKFSPGQAIQVIDIKDTISGLFPEERQTFPSLKRTLYPTQAPVKAREILSKDRMKMIKNHLTKMKRILWTFWEELRERRVN